MSEAVHNGSVYDENGRQVLATPNEAVGTPYTHNGNLYDSLGRMIVVGPGGLPLGRGPQNYWTPGDAIAETYPRVIASSSITPASGSMYWVGGCVLPAGATAEGVRYCANAKATTPTHYWAALAIPDESGAEEAAVVATSQDRLEAPWEANEEKLFSFKAADGGSGVFKVTEDTPVYCGIVQVAATPATIRGVSGSGQINGIGTGRPFASLGPGSLIAPGSLASVVALGATALTPYACVTGTLS